VPDVGSCSGSGGNGTVVCVVSGLDYGTTYYWFVNVSDGSNWTNRTFWFVTESLSNQPPVVWGELPVNGSSGVSVGVGELSVDLCDPEGDFMSWSIVTVPDVGSCSGSGGNGTVVCVVSGLDYGTTYYWFVNVSDSSGCWSNKTYFFITASAGGNEGGGNNGDDIQPPVADAGGPYEGKVNETIIFDGSGSLDSDGEIVNYTWHFGDGFTAFTEKPTHKYRNPGIYVVILMVKDNDGLTDTATTTANISFDSGSVDGPDRANVSTPRGSPLATDDEPAGGLIDSDSIVDIDKDGLSDVIEELLGSDAQDASDIDNISINNVVHYLVDVDGDGLSDVFYNSTSGIYTRMDNIDNRKYLIDEDGDGYWDYCFDVTYWSLSPYIPEEEVSSSSEMWIVIAVVISAFFIGLVIFFRDEIRLFILHLDFSSFKEKVLLFRRSLHLFHRAENKCPNEEVSDDPVLDPGKGMSDERLSEGSIRRKVDKLLEVFDLDQSSRRLSDNPEDYDTRSHVDDIEKKVDDLMNRRLRI
jgi:chitodextrinase